MTSVFPPNHQPFSQSPPDSQPFNHHDLVQRATSRSMSGQSRPTDRMSGEYANRRSYSGGANDSITVSGSQYQNGSRNSAQAPGVSSLSMGRSPPTKNTKHVPCKFFRQGACQAGQACPFLHSTDTAVDQAPCKYFTKGNCKFGAKCALAHILPDGRRVNRNNLQMAMNPGHLNLGGRVNPPAYHPHDSALANSLLSQQQINGMPYPGPYLIGEDYSDRMYDQMAPSIDVGFSSNPTSKYGSPVEDSRLPISPAGHHLSTLDAPLPASFDSNGISHIARYGPVAASVPSKFAIDSPPASFPKRVAGPSDAIKALHDTAYANMRNLSSNLGSSPPGLGEENNGPRILHSQRLPRSKPVSASLPRAGADDWDDGFAMEEDLLPPNLHDEVLTPQEKARRTSRSEQEYSAPRDVAGPRGIPTSANSSKVGSPMGSSPSRFASLFAKQRQQREGEAGAPSGHVGSPLRESVLSQRPAASISMNARWASSDSAQSLSSPPRQSSMSTLSQQLRSMQLKRTESGDSSGGIHPPIGSRQSSSRFDRTISSPGLSTTRIDEEAGDLVFSMEEEDTSKRNSSIWTEGKP